MSEWGHESVRAVLAVAEQHTPEYTRPRHYLTEATTAVTVKPRGACELLGELLDYIITGEALTGTARGERWPRLGSTLFSALD